MRRFLFVLVAAGLFVTPSLAKAGEDASMKRFCRERYSTAKEVNLCVIELRKGAYAEKRQAQQEKDAARKEQRAAIKQRKIDIAKEEQRAELVRQQLAIQQQQAANEALRLETERQQASANAQGQSGGNLSGADCARANSGYLFVGPGESGFDGMRRMMDACNGIQRNESRTSCHWFGSQWVCDTQDK